MVSVSFRYLFYQLVDEKIKTWPLRFPIKENPNVEKALFDWPIVLQYDVKGKYRLSSTKFSGIKFFHRSLRSTNQKPRTFVSVQWINLALFLFDSFVVCVLLARFHFKIIRKSLYVTFSLVVLFFCLFFFNGRHILFPLINTWNYAIENVFPASIAWYKHERGWENSRQ